MRKYSYAEALDSLYPNTTWRIPGDLYSDIEWHESNTIPKPDKAVLDAEVARLQAEYDSQQYARDRVKEYPSIGDQLDALFHAGVFPTEMSALIQAVKDKYPKGGA